MTPGIADQIEPGQTVVPSQTAPRPRALAVPGPSGAFGQTIAGWAGSIRDAVMGYCVPGGIDDESIRRARLITGFGVIGAMLGMAFAILYLCIGHLYGASVIGFFVLGLGSVPLLLRAAGSVRLAGNLLLLFLLVAFAALCAVEGGHSIGWLVAVPLAAFLMVDLPEAAAWSMLTVVITGCFVIFDLSGVRLPLLYPATWQDVIITTRWIGSIGVVSALGFVFEIERRRAMARVETAAAAISEGQVQLKKLEAEKSEFLQVVSHDLKNPLNIIIGFGELIAAGRNGSPERDHDDARYIIEAADRMIRLIAQLLDVNAMEQGQFPIEIGECDLGLISRQVAASFADAASKKRISIYAAGPLTPAHVLADPKAICRILENLLSNAIKFSPTGSDIFTRMRNAPEGVIWEVQDQGAGISEAEQLRLFRKYGKLTPRPTGGEPSTGLGLYLAMMLAKAMNGTIECESDLGQGTTFLLRLPAAKPENAEGLNGPPQAANI